MFRNVFLIVSIFILLVINSILGGSIIGALTLISGMIYVWLIMNKRKSGMVAGSIYSGLYGYTSFLQNINGEAFISSIVQFGFCIYGYFKWGKIQGTDGKIVPKNITLIEILAIPVIAIIIYFGLTYIGSSVVLIDTISTTVALVASYAMAKGMKINTWLWSSANMLNCILWVIRGNYALAAMFAIFLINSIYGIYVYYKKPIENEKIEGGL